MNYIAQINHRSELKNKSQSLDSNIHQESSKIGNSEIFFLVSCELFTFKLCFHFSDQCQQHRISGEADSKGV